MDLRKYEYTTSGAPDKKNESETKEKKKEYKKREKGNSRLLGLMNFQDYYMLYLLMKRGRSLRLRVRLPKI
jgi:hypothetical protein